ncbi:sensor histidine kinase [Streptomyces poriticola]|uniref:sensor histidine kinase n=1 Tax=Streptomyces poriticola TaxID=3120506 RepID=UPI002FCDFE60
MHRPGGWWRRKNTPEKVETYTRWSFHFFGVIEILSIGLSSFDQVGTRPAGMLSLLVVAHAALCMTTASRALDWTRGRRPQPVRMLWVLGAATAVLAVGALGVGALGPDEESVHAAVGGVYGGVLCFGAGIMTLGLGSRRRVIELVGGFAVGAGGMVLAVGLPWPAALAALCAVLAGAGFLAFTSVFSVWLLNAVYELDEARETRARLAVAEERLRFGRDLHDVLGRNLAVVALKSELAVQLARRGRPEAVEQMIEVQRIAHESQREVRDVVRGYREADLEAELAGAHGVLTAAGIDCEVTGAAAGLPAEVQSALGWVVREATTNVLRHGDARRCAVAVGAADGRVVLTVENDGAGSAAEGAGHGGTGLAGLRERLSAVDGTLRAGRAGADAFRLVAEVPLASSQASVVEVVS